MTGKSSTNGLGQLGIDAQGCAAPMDGCVSFGMKQKLPCLREATWGLKGSASYPFSLGLKKVTANLSQANANYQQSFSVTAVPLKPRCPNWFRLKVPQGSALCAPVGMAFTVKALSLIFSIPKL